MKIFRFVSILLNIGVIALILGLSFGAHLAFDNLNSWVFFAVAMATPVVNISGLLRRPKWMKPFASLLINSLVLALFSVVMLLVMIWPMGSKPRGAELFCLAFLFAALLFTEFSLLLEIRRK